MKSIENAEIVALCDFRKDVTAALCRRWDIPKQTDSVEELLSMDIDAVYVLPPVQWHLHNIKAAIKADKQVFTEKPAVMSAASANELKRTASSSRASVTVGYMKRHEANIAELKKIQAENDWGKMLFIRTHSFIGGHWNAAINDLVPVTSSEETFGFDASLLDPAPAWLKDEQDEKFYSFDNPYYGLLDTGCHSVNLLRHLADKTPEVQSARNILQTYILISIVKFPGLEHSTFLSAIDYLGVIVAALASIAACIREEHNKQAKDKLKDWFGAKFEGTVKTINAPKAEIIDVTADECNKTCHECNDVIEVSAKFCEHCGAKQNVY